MIKCTACGNLYPDIKASCSSCGFGAPLVDGFPAWAPELAHESSGFKAEYFSELAQLEAGNFWFKGRNALIVWCLNRYFPQFSSFMEIGCGTGYVLSGIKNAFPAARLVGSEIFSAGLSFASQRIPEALFVQMDAREIPYYSEYDVVAAFDVLEHIDDDETVLRNMYQAVRPGGGVVLTVPQHQWLWSATDQHACHVRRYDANDLHSKVAKAGFEIVRSTSFVSLLLPAMLFSRLHAKRKNEFDPLDEFRIGRGMNFLLEVMMTLERSLIKFGMDFPMGGSRLIVARKGA